MRNVSPALAWAALASLAIAAAAVGFRPLIENSPAPAASGAAPITGVWVAHVAPTSVCRGGDDPAGMPSAQRRTMSCLVNYARAVRGVAPVVLVAELRSSAAEKARLIVDCGRFAHDPCGGGADAVFRRAGYGRGFTRAAYSENIAIMSSAGASPRVILNAWLNSPHHRENLFRPDWREQGVALLRGVSVGDEHGVTVWVSQFGARS